MKKQDVLQLFNGLQAVSNLPGAKWSYAVAKNMVKLRPEVEALQKALTPDQEFIEYDKKRQELAEKYAVKKDGMPKKVKVGNIEEYLIADKDKFNKELFKLQETYKKALDERKKQVDDFIEILEEKIEVELHMVDSEYIPEGITPAQLSKVMPIIREKKVKT